jgi:ketol-acid reductoisomerase
VSFVGPGAAGTVGPVIETSLENQAGRPSYGQLRQAEQDHDVEQVGERLRGLFAWDEADEQTEPEVPADD